MKDLIANTEYTRVELKTDGESALMDVPKRTKQISDMEIILKNPPRHDPQSNGITERTVSDFKNQLRTTKIALERRIKVKISLKSPVLKWMIGHFVG